MSTPYPDQTLPGDLPHPEHPIYHPPSALDKLQEIFTLLLKAAAIAALLMYTILAQRGCAIVDDVPHPEHPIVIPPTEPVEPSQELPDEPESGSRPEATPQG